MTTDIRVGDRFLIEVEVTTADADDFAHHKRVVRAEYNANGPWHLDVPAGVLLKGKRLPRAIRVGDRVHVPRRADCLDAFVVLAIDEHVAWMKCEVSGHRSQERLDELALCNEASP